MTANEVDAILEEHGAEPWALVAVLQQIQEREGFLSEGSLRHVALRMNMELPQVYGVATFFKSLRLRPEGKHEVVVCCGTACHVRGAPRIANEISSFLDVRPDETTDDGLFTLKVVNCLGVCAIGPVVVVDGEYHGAMTPLKAKELLDEYRRGDDEQTQKSG
ncbi:MAG: NAD(P)H-dependent oxidoreductase subunit E [Armatimonadota bacterium]